MPITIDYVAAQDWAVRIGGAIIILIIAHFAAKAVKWAIAKAVDRIPFFSRRDGR